MSVLQVVQPGLAGLMGGSVSTPTPLFAATTSTWVTFLVGPRGLVGVGKRGASLATRRYGVMTFIGGIGHTLPYSLSNFRAATALAVAAGAG
ncbi:MAG: hypothetical protein WDN31_14980 [Hyphomicrobium sp.]